MAPVIRISDDVFRKLQLLGEPLVDTPNSVIERLLHQVAAASSPPGEVPTRRNGVVSTSEPNESHQSTGLFLAPANAENIKATLTNAVSIEALEERLNAQTVVSLKAALDGRRSFHCWAMTTSSRGTYDNMKAGDLVIFTPKGTGRFTYRACVLAKIESQALGELLWSVTPGRPWSLIYVLHDVRPINVSKEKLVSEFGYDRSFPVYGITRVAPERLHSALARRGNLEAVLEAATV